MIKYSIPVSPAVTIEHLEHWLRTFGADQGASLGSRTTLRTIPGSAHWHMTRGGGSGTVEITLDFHGRSITVGVHDNRRGFWAVGAAETLVSILSGAARVI